MSDSQKMKDDGSITVEISTISEAGRQHRVDSVVRETEARLKVDGRLCTQLFCLPYHFEELAIGYLTIGGFDPTYIANIEVKEVDLAIYELLVTLEKKVYRIDKLVGACITKGIAISESVLVTSCRQTYTTMKKEICAGFPITISVSAPTALAVKEADEFGMTLIGFARDKRFNVYANDWRIV